MSAAVTFDCVAKRFGANTVLSGVSVDCPEGLTTAIVGASGCGKTTLLQLVNGVLRPDEGTVRVFGEPVPQTEVEQFRRKIGYAVQGAALFPHMTVKANICLVARLQGWSVEDMDQRMTALLEQMDLSADIAERLPREISGGQQQRVGLCRALMLKPKLLLLDEPFSAVDPITRVEIYEQFERVQAHEGVTSLLVTHDLREARRLAGYLIILHMGQVKQHGTTQEVLTAPDNDYVKKLVESQLS